MLAGLALNHSRVKYLADIDSWPLRLVVNGAFQQKSRAGQDSEDGRGGQRNGNPRAPWRRFHSLDQVFERGFHQQMLDSHSPTSR